MNDMFKSELFLILSAFQKAWKSKFRERIHALPAYPNDTELYKKVCRISKNKKTNKLVSSANWQGFYPRISESLNKLRNLTEPYMLALFDSNLAVINIDCIYDSESKEHIDLNLSRNSVRNEIIAEVQKFSSNFIIEDSIQGFHLIFWCRQSNFYSTAYQYITLGGKYICRYNILSSRYCKQTINLLNLTLTNIQRTSGNYCLLGYRKQIPSYEILFVGNGNGLSNLPTQFRQNNYLSYVETMQYNAEQAQLKEADYRKALREEIFYRWFLEANHSRREEIAIEKIINRYNEAVRKNAVINDDKGFIKDSEGNNIDFNKLSPDTPMLKVDAVRRATIESVYKFYSYLNSLAVGTTFNNTSIVEKFVSFCKLNDLELRGLWSHLNGKLLFTNRFYKVLLNLIAKDDEPKLYATSNYFEIKEHIDKLSKQDAEQDEEDLSDDDEESNPFIDFSDSQEDGYNDPFSFNPIIEYDYTLNSSFRSPAKENSFISLKNII